MKKQSVIWLGIGVMMISAAGEIVRSYEHQTWSITKHVRVIQSNTSKRIKDKPEEIEITICASKIK
jgi:hypothetical protein